MREMIKMVVVLTLLSTVSGGLLAGVRSGTQEKITEQQLIFEQAPAILSILSDVENDPVKDRFTLKDGEIERTFFVGKKDGAAKVVVFETFGKGFGGKVGLMVGFNLEDGTVSGVGVTTHSETPGLGSMAKSDPSFSAQFQGLSSESKAQVIGDGGTINAIGGATITSKAVCGAATEACEIYNRLKTQIQEAIGE